MKSTTPHTRGFSLAELALVVFIVGALASVTVPALVRVRASAVQRGGRSEVQAALWLTRSTSAQWGRTARLAIDTASDQLSVWVDTTIGGGGSDSLLVRVFPIGSDLEVELESNLDGFCLNSRGIATAAAGCTATSGEIWIRRPDGTDTVRINSVGRVWR